MKIIKLVTEVYKPIPGFEGLYEVSNLGNVKSIKRYARSNPKKSGPKRKILSPSCIRGYYQVGLGGKVWKVHRLVALAFILNPENKPG